MSTKVAKRQLRQLQDAIAPKDKQPQQAPLAAKKAKRAFKRAAKKRSAAAVATAGPRETQAAALAVNLGAPAAYT